MITPFRPKRRAILSLTGGGLRGVAAAAVLERIEALGRERFGQSYRLARSFDLAAGASTGAVMATAVALGFEAKRIVAFYRDDAPKVFRRKTFAVPLITEYFCSKALHAHYAAATQGRRLRRADLQTHLGVVVKNASAVRPALLTTWRRPANAPKTCLGAELSDAQAPLADLLRASTAAPGLFAPTTLPIGPHGAAQACVDGGVTPFNDPSFLVTTMMEQAAAAEGLAPPSIDLLSIGAGLAEPRHHADKVLRMAAGPLAFSALKSMVIDAERQADALMRARAQESATHEAATQKAAAPRLTYQALNMPLNAEAMEELGLSVSRDDLRRMRSISDPRGVPLLYEAATAWAERLLPRFPEILAEPEPARTTKSFSQSEKRPTSKPSQRLAASISQKC